MCTNYRAPNRIVLRSAFGAEPAEGLSWAEEVWPDRPAPILRRNDAPGAAAPEAVLARFRLIPFSVKDPKGFRASTMNARTETVDRLFSFRGAFARRQWCVIPATAFFEPYYETADARSVRWSVQRSDRQPFGIAGIWDRWQRDSAEPIVSFAMLTINCDAHPLLRRFHVWFDADGKPEEKRSPVLLREDEIDRWLAASVDEVRGFFRTFEAEELHVEAAPLPRRGRAPAAGQ